MEEEILQYINSGCLTSDLFSFLSCILNFFTVTLIYLYSYENSNINTLTINFKSKATKFRPLNYDYVLN